MNLQDILIVDAAASIRDDLAGYLSRHAFADRSAAGSAEMDRLLAAALTDLVLLDLIKPGEHGLSVRRRVRPGGSAHPDAERSRRDDRQDLRA